MRFAKPGRPSLAALCGFLIATAALGTPCASEAQPAPYHHYKTLETPHFRVHVSDGLEREGRVAAAAAERAYALLSRELVAPRGTIDLVVSDDADYANGNATPVPSNRINIFAAPPIENQGLRFNDDWIEIVVTHELTHIFHLDRARGWWAEAQHVFGRAPFLFPNMYGPAWLTEGLAVYYESRLTSGGRLHENNNRLVARAAARDNVLPRIDQISLSAPGFPGGEGAYHYGALFVEYLSRTRGDSAVGKFVEQQSTQVIPFLLNRPAKQSFGISLSDAFAAWRDSVQTHADSVTAPFPGWRDLTSRSLYAAEARWLNASTLVYSGTDGRETNAAFRLSLDGRRERLGRRNGVSANTPMPDGSLLYSQLDFIDPSIARSDLYRQWPDGHVQRLTHGARLIQPDVRRDGTIVAVQLDAARSRLVLLDSASRIQRVLREGAPDETWSEPAWSNDGRSVAAIRRRHGGEFSLEVIDVATDRARVIDRGRYVIASPRWRGDGLIWTSERSGTPTLMQSVGAELAMKQGAGVAIFWPDVAPRAPLLSATVLRGDGYHVGVATLPPLAGREVAVLDSVSPAPARADSQPLATGTYHTYSAWRTVLPRFWYPIIESAPASGLRLGATTSGQDVLGRHFYTVYGAVPTTGRQPIGGVFYRYAGLRRPLIDVSAAQDWASEGTITDISGNPIGTLLKRTQDVSLAATFTRPRVRTFSAVSAGIALERRRFATDPMSLLPLIDASYSREFSFPRAFLGAQWTNAQRPSLSISPEDGIALAATARERLRADDPGSTASLSVVGTAAGYKSLDLPGFAHHVLALRVSGGYADRRTGTALEVGGTSGSIVEIIPGYIVGEGRRTFSVRGFEGGAIYGTSAAAASLEYRAPLALGGRGYGLLPFFFDRASLTAFGDAGVATCASNPLYSTICSPVPRIGRTIASVGAELGISVAILSWDGPEAIRVGVAAPVVGRELTGAQPVSAYLAFGLSF